MVRRGSPVRVRKRASRNALDVIDYSSEADLIQAAERGNIADDAAEPDVRGRRVHGLALASCVSVAEAVVGCAEVRAALGHPARDALAVLPVHEVLLG
jgi:hypothetical protein